jgi:hypothetical protein
MRKEFYSVWTALSVIFLLIIVLALSGAGCWIGSHVPPCPARLAGTRCALCGMTRAFHLLARGEIGDAYRLNHGAPPLFGLLALNTLFFLSHLMSRGYGWLRCMGASRPWGPIPSFRSRKEVS